MNQYDYKIKTKEKIGALWMQLKEINFSGGELNLQDTMKLYKGELDRAKFLKRQVTNFKNMYSTCCTDGYHHRNAAVNESVLKDKSGDSFSKKNKHRPQRVDFTNTSHVIREYKQGRW